MLICYTDGARRAGHDLGVCASCFIVYRDGEEVYRSGRVLDGLQTNNVAEYTAVIDALKWAAEHYESLQIKCDSQLVVRQTNCEWDIKHEHLKPFVAEAFSLLHATDSTLEWVKGHNGEAGNEAVDALGQEILKKKLSEMPDTQKSAKEK